MITTCMVRYKLAEATQQVGCDASWEVKHELYGATRPIYCDLSCLLYGVIQVVWSGRLSDATQILRGNTKYLVWHIRLSVVLWVVWCNMISLVHEYILMTGVECLKLCIHAYTLRFAPALMPFFSEQISNNFDSSDWKQFFDSKNWLKWIIILPWKMISKRLPWKNSKHGVQLRWKHISHSEKNQSVDHLMF